MTKIKKNTHLLSICRCTLIFLKGCACTSLSLSLSIYICKNGLDPDQTEMEFREECFINEKNCACDRKYAKCRTKTVKARSNGFSVYLNKCRPTLSGPMRGSRGGTEGPDPPENHKNIEFLSNTGPDPLKFSKLPSQHSTLGHHWHASETPFKGVSLAGR